MTLLTAGPVRNGGDLGGLVVFQTNGVVAADVNDSDSGTAGYQPAKLKLIASDLTSPANNTNQTVNLVNATFTATGAPGTTGIIQAYVTGQTPAAGGNLAYAAYIDSDQTAGTGLDKVNASEPRVQVTATTAGAPTAITLTPASQSVAKDVYSGDYNGTLKDDAGRTTQLSGSEAVNLDASAGVGTTTLKVRNEPYNPSGAATYGADTATTAPIAKAGIPLGTFAFQAKNSSVGPASIDIAVKLGATKVANANLVVVASATNLSTDEIDIVTGADGWNGFGNGGAAIPSPVPVRVDQTAVKINIADDPTDGTNNAGKTVVLNAAAGGAGALTFGGKTSASFTAVLGADGKGSITVTPDAGTISENSTITITGAGINQTIRFERSTLTSVATDAKTYVSKFGGSVDVTVTAKDQFGLPATGSYVGLQRKNGVNKDTVETKKAVDASGKAVFTLTDTKATVALNTKDDVFVDGYADGFAASPVIAATDKADIVYSATGTGGDFALSADLQPVASPVYDPAAAYATLPPLTDGVDDSDAEDVNIGISGGTAGAPVSISASNGALILPTGKYTLADASASVTEALDGTGAAAFNVVGTKAGTSTVTVVSGGVTKTAVVTVKTLADNTATARNLAVTGPDSANSNDIVDFTVKVTDAFGNPVVGFDGGDLNTLVTGPGHVNGDIGESDATGAVTIPVELDSDAGSPVTLTVRGQEYSFYQFGASANYVYDSDDAGTPTPTATGPGLSASVATATAKISDVVSISDLQDAVDKAQAAVDVAQNNLDNAKGDLSVAKTEQSVAKSEVKQAKKALKKAKKHHKGVDAAKKNLNEAKGDKKIADSKVKVANKKVTNAKATLAAAKEKLAEAQQALEDAQNEG